MQKGKSGNGRGATAWVFLIDYGDACGLKECMCNGVDFLIACGMNDFLVRGCMC